METIILKKYEKIFIENNIYIIQKGKILFKYVFEEGNSLANSKHLKKGELIGNFFQLDSEVEISPFYLEVLALETVILERIYQINLNKNSIYQKIISHLLKVLASNIDYRLKDKKELILYILKSLSNSRGIVQKQTISPDLFDLSKSQYYLLISKLKNEKKLDEGINIFKIY